MTKLTVFCGRRGRGGRSSETSDVNNWKSLCSDMHTVLFGLYCNGHSTGHTKD